jgi:transposase, IS30 family
VRAIAADLRRSPSTISRELRRNQEVGGGYRASSAHAMAYHRASRPKVAKLVSNLALREKVEHDLEKRYSPEQITGRLRVEFPDDPEMRVSPETIYQSLYVQSRGALRRDLAVCLADRAGAAAAEPQGRSAQEPHPEHDQYCGTSGRGRRPGGARKRKAI